MGRALIGGKVKWKKMRRLRMRREEGGTESGWRAKLKLMHRTSVRFKLPRARRWSGIDYRAACMLASNALTSNKLVTKLSFTAERDLVAK